MKLVSPIYYLVFYFMGCSLSFLTLYGQHPIYQTYTEADGLVSNAVVDILQDNKGYIWFATHNGLSRFDGKTFTNYSEEDGLYQNRIINLYKDRKGRIWAWGRLPILSYFEHGRFHNFDLTEHIHFRINNIFVDREMNIWVGEPYKYLKFSPDFELLEQFNVTGARSFLENEDGNISITNGFGIVNLVTDSLIHIPQYAIHHWLKWDNQTAVYSNKGMLHLPQKPLLSTDLSEQFGNSIRYSMHAFGKNELWVTSLAKKGAFYGTFENNKFTIKKLFFSK